MSDETNPLDLIEPDLPANEGVSDETAVDDDLLNDGLDDEEEGLAEEFEEIERNGKRYQIPKDLKSELMMQADYTRKTQEVAEARRALEAQRAEVEQQAKASQERIQLHAQRTHAEQTLAQYQAIDWAALEAEDFTVAQTRWREFQQWKDYKAGIESAIQQDETKRTVEAQQTFAKRQQEANEALSREIKGWGPELASKLDAFSRTLGYSEQDVQEAIQKGTLPRLVKTVHRAYLGEQLIQKQKAAAARPANPDAEPIKPLAKVSTGRAPVRAGLSDDLSAEEWAKRRNDQLRRKG